jgi:hypothetical protein
LLKCAHLCIMEHYGAFWAKQFDSAWTTTKLAILNPETTECFARDIMLNIPPSTTNAEGGQPRKITAVLVTESGRHLFKLRAQGETIPLLDSGSLNQWAAQGLTVRHQIAFSQDGLTIDGRKIRFADPHATDELEQILNLPPKKTPAAKRADPSHLPVDPQSSSDLALCAALAKSLHVTRDGFEFHVSFRTKFGETKTEKLEEAMATLQNMRVFKPHLSMQKSGIRLVVTRWDGESFIEEPGIENVEHASPEEIEALIKGSIRGTPDIEGAGEEPGPHPRKQVTRIEIMRKNHESRFHIVFHYNDGHAEEGPLMIRANLARINGEGVFRPDVSISISALNDRITVQRLEADGSNPAPRTDTFSLGSGDDAKRIENILNACLRSASDSSPALPRSENEATVQPEPSAAEAIEPKREVVAAPEESPIEQSLPVAPSAQADLPGAAAPPASEVSAVAEVAESSGEDWVRAALKAAGSLSLEEVNSGIFTALRTRLGRSPETNEYGFPFLAFERQEQSGHNVALELVLTPHYLLCAGSFGYLRFGAETRIYHTRLDDYIAYPSFALRGLANSGAGPLFVVAPEFLRWLGGASEKAYRAQFGPMLLDAAQLSPGCDLIWPLSREETLYDLLAAAAREYGLPVTADSVVLAPDSDVFIGFKKLAPRGMEFRNGMEYVRFMPGEVELLEGSARFRFRGGPILCGWALDEEQRLCALYREVTGFVPPETKLLRFLSEEERAGAQGTLTVLAALDIPQG